MHVRCQKCGTTFVAAADAPSPSLSAASPPSDPLGGIDLAALPPMRSSPALGGAANPLGTPISSSLGSYSQTLRPAASSAVSNPLGGPTDTVIRLICGGGFLGGGLVLLAISAATNAARGMVYLTPLLLAPLLIVWGIAGLIAPNVIRGAGKFGGHLPWHYKAIFYGLMGVWFLIVIVMLVGLAASGYRSGP